MGVRPRVGDRRASRRQGFDRHRIGSGPGGHGWGNDLLVFGASGERFDHALGTLAALGNPLLTRFETIRLLLDETVVHIIHPGRSVTIDLPQNTSFSLLALHGSCSGVDVMGARWPLANARVRALEHPRYQQRDNRASTRRRHGRHSHSGGPMKRLLAVLRYLPRVAVGCGSDSATSGKPAAITLVAYDSFPPEKTTLNEALDEFTKSTGIAVKIVIAGDAGTMVTKAALTAGNPEGDVMWGVDNTLLSAALDGKVFDKYEPNDSSAIAPSSPPRCRATN